MNVGDRVRTLREARGWSQGQLLLRAQRHLGAGETLSRVTLSRLENGHRRPRSGILAAIAAALGVTVDYLLGSEDAGVETPGPNGVPIPQPELVAVVRRLNSLPGAGRERAADFIDSFLDWYLEGQDGAEVDQSVEEEGDLGFELDAEDRELDALLRTSGLDAETLSAVWEVIGRTMRSRRLRK
jgi:transcriptional regulator with XRE-family HTH domain